MGRIVCQFSCGAASAVATKLAISQFGHGRIVIVNAFLVEEDEDNRRFAEDCARWFEHPITVLRDEKYGASAHEVWRRERFIKGPWGASCSMRLKRELLETVFQPDDTLVMGFTADEMDRAQRFIEAGAICPLVDRGLTKPDCLAMIERAGLVLPRMYGLGFNNANCRGCCKGGKGYWNKIRKIFPQFFETTARIEQEIGPGAYLFYDRKTGERFSLLELDPNEGDHDEVLPDCSFFCAMAEEEIA